MSFSRPVCAWPTSAKTTLEAGCVIRARNYRFSKMQLRTKLASFVTFVLLMQASPHWAMQIPAASPPDKGAARKAEHLPSYVLGPNDEIVILSVLAEEIANKP